MSNLVIVESPAKCSKIQGFLGSDWKCVATFGHIRSLQEDLDAVGLDRDFEPKYMFMKEKAKSIANLKEAAKHASTIYLASDDDREGEAIAYSVAVLLGLNPATTPRAVFHEITATAVRAAVATPRFIDMNRVNAQQARSVLDMMVGFTISPLLWKYVGPALSAGRCQTPALRILCEREDQIKSFRADTVWKLKGTWSTPQGFGFPAQLKDELEDKESAVNFLENLHDDNKATVLHAITKGWTEGPPKPLITSTLQQEASALYSSNPKKTMAAAQRLYEQGYITYMRTDHAILSEEAKTSARGLVTKLYGDSYLGSTEAPKHKAKKTNSQDPVPAAQEAHEAIRPTHFDVVMLGCDEKWDTIERNIYRLIWCRSMQSVMASAKGDERVTTFLAAGDPGEFPWEAKWKRTTFAGWRKVGLSTVALDETEMQAEEESAQATWIQAISLREGDTIAWKQLEAGPVTSKASPRFNEATLVRELEKRGIGRPSTYASLVGTLLEKKYAEKKDTPAKAVQIATYILSSLGQWPPKEDTQAKSIGAEKDKLVPTPLGLSLLGFCLKEFGSLFEYGFTAGMETRLDKIAQGDEPWKQVCRDTWDSYKDHLAELKQTKGSAATKPASAKVKEFSNGLKAVLGKKGPLLLKEDPSGEKDKTAFYGWPAGVSFQEMDEAAALAFLQTAAAPPASVGTHEGHPISVKKGPFGFYAECNGIKVPCLDGDTEDTLVSKFQAKKESAVHKLGSFEFRKGPYGLYMFKKESGGKKPAFVSLPEGLDPKSLTQEAAETLYKSGIAQKAAGGGRGGGRGGRGRGGRGRGGRGRGGGTA